MKDIEKIKELESVDLGKAFECLEKYEKGQLTAEEGCKELGMTKALWNQLLKMKQLYVHKKPEC